jgi:hypothetical protein
MAASADSSTPRDAATALRVARAPMAVMLLLTCGRAASSMAAYGT